MKIFFCWFIKLKRWEVFGGSQHYALSVTGTRHSENKVGVFTRVCTDVGVGEVKEQSSEIVMEGNRGGADSETHGESKDIRLFKTIR